MLKIAHLVERLCKDVFVILEKIAQNALCQKWVWRTLKKGDKIQHAKQRKNIVKNHVQNDFKKTLLNLGFQEHWGLAKTKQKNLAFLVTSLCRI
jgi:hypothetical protein